MTVRKLHAAAGARHRVHYSPPYGLPEPLSGDTVEVIEWDHAHYRVQLDDGSERMVFSGNVITRCEYLLGPGVWVGLEHTAVREHHARMMAEMRARIPEVPFFARFVKELEREHTDA
jgi:hypothetical protein